MAYKYFLYYILYRVRYTFSAVQTKLGLVWYLFGIEPGGRFLHNKLTASGVLMERQGGSWEGGISLIYQSCIHFRGPSLSFSNSKLAFPPLLPDPFHQFYRILSYSFTGSFPPVLPDSFLQCYWIRILSSSVTRSFPPVLSGSFLQFYWILTPVLPDSDPFLQCYRIRISSTTLSNYIF